MATSAHGPVRVLMDLVHEAADEVPGEPLDGQENANHERPKPLLRSDWTIYRGGAVSSSNETVDLYLRPYLLRYRFQAIFRQTVFMGSHRG